MTDEKAPKEDQMERSGARERVKRHLRKVLTTAAVAGVGAAAMACDEIVVCDPLPPPDSGPAAGDPGPGDPGGDVRMNGTDSGNEGGDGDGAIVCDPLPPPYDGDPD